MDLSARPVVEYVIPEKSSGAAVGALAISLISLLPLLLLLSNTGSNNGSAGALGSVSVEGDSSRLPAHNDLVTACGHTDPWTECCTTSVALEAAQSCALGGANNSLSADNNILRSGLFPCPACPNATSPRLCVNKSTWTGWWMCLPT